MGYKNGFIMIPNIVNWVDMVADQLADMFNKLSIEDNDNLCMEIDRPQIRKKKLEPDEEPIIGRDIEIVDSPPSSTYSEKSEGSDDKTYSTDESDNSKDKESDSQLMTSVHFLIPKGIVKKYVMDIVSQYGEDYDFENEALDALQTALESHLIKLFEISKMIANHYSQKEIKPLDVSLANKFI